MIDEQPIKRATLPYRITDAPERLKKAKLDTIALVPASLLPFREPTNR